MRKRHTRQLLIAAALGMLTTLALAWLGPIALYGVLPFKWYRSSCLIESRVADLAWSRTMLRDHTSVMPEDSGFLTNAPLAEYPVWYTPPRAWEDAIRIDTNASGFPFRALSCTAFYAYATNRSNFRLQSLHGGLELSRTSSRLDYLPLTPLWPGLLADIAIWSAAWWALLAGVGAIRRWRRSRMIGRCAKCGYDLRGLPAESACPECGQSTAKR